MLDLIPLYLCVGPHPIPRPAHLYDYILAEQGLIKRVENRVFSVDHLLAPLGVELIGLGLQPYRLQPLRFKLPRIPGRLLEAALAEARANLHQEVMVQFRFEPGREWSLSWPEQARSGWRVRYTEPDPANVAVDLHSHHTMAAYFSPVDDRDEQGGRLYGVIGRLDQPRPELVLRAGLYGHWIYNIPALAIFDELGPLVETSLDPAETDQHFNAPSVAAGWLANLNPFRRSE